MPNLYKNTRQQEKTTFKTHFSHALSSLHEVECFLNNFNDFYKYIKVYKILRK